MIQYIKEVTPYYILITQQLIKIKTQSLKSFFFPSSVKFCSFCTLSLFSEIKLKKKIFFFLFPQVFQHHMLVRKETNIIKKFKYRIAQIIFPGSIRFNCVRASNDKNFNKQHTNVSKYESEFFLKMHLLSHIEEQWIKFGYKKVIRDMKRIHSI